MHGSSKPADSVPHVLSHIRQLQYRTTRDRHQTFWIEGIRNFVQACDAKLRFQTIIQSDILLKSSLAEMLTRRLVHANVRRVRVTPEQFRSVSLTERASGIGAIVRQHCSQLQLARPNHGLCWLIFESIRSPGNLGTILRTAEACGVSGIIFLGPSVDPFDPAVVRASMGGIFHLQLIRSNRDEFASWAQHHGMTLVGLSPDAPRLWTDLPGTGPLGIVLGEERTGLSESLLQLCKFSVRLPMTGKADSLNVSIAAGIMMYELVRRRRSPTLNHDISKSVVEK